MKLRFYHFIFFFLIFNNVKAKNDNVKLIKNLDQQKKRINKDHPRLKVLKDSRIHKRKAMLYSMIFPGLGQIYNKEYWTALSFLGLIGLAGWFTVFSHNESIRYQILDSTNNVQYSSKVNHHIRNRDIGFIIMGTLYVINIIQAYISASMETFDISDDLSFIMDSNDANDGINLNLRIN